MFYVYLLQSIKNKSIYIGYSSNLKQRLNQHNNGENTSTKKDKPWKLIYYEAYQSKEDAISRERRLKHHAKGLIELKKRITTSLDENGEG